MEMIRNFLSSGKEISWDAMRFMTGEINYGGNVTDDFDRRLLVNILDLFQNEEVAMSPDYKFSPSGIYYIPVHETNAQIINFIDQLPQEDDPEIFWMHANANLIY